jgi:hypothetical protein
MLTNDMITKYKTNYNLYNRQTIEHIKLPWIIICRHGAYQYILTVTGRLKIYH